MTSNPFDLNSTSPSHRPPFGLELRYHDLRPDGTFTPSSAVLVTPALAKSGLLRLLSAEELQTLLLVLSHVTANGTFVATAESLAPVLGMGTGRIRSRLECLIRRRWNGEPLLRCYTTESGLRLFSPSPALFEFRRSQITPTPDAPGIPLEMPPPWRPGEAVATGNFREEIIAHSRERYGRPRAEVEAEINRFLGYGDPEGESENLTPEEEAQRDLGRRLVEAGLTSYQARSLVDSYPQDRIETQLQYLPYRNARYPAGMLVASIEGDYAAPPGARVGSVNDVSGQSESSVTDISKPRGDGEDTDSVPVQHLSDLDSNKTVNLSLPPDTVEPEVGPQDSEAGTDE